MKKIGDKSSATLSQTELRVDMVQQTLHFSETVNSTLMADQRCFSIP